MAIGGRKPKPTALRVLEGNRSDRPIKQEPEFPEAPKSARHDPPFPLDPMEMEEWERVCGALTDAGVVTAPDLATLALYCAAMGKAKRAYKHMRRKSMTVEGAPERINAYERLFQQYSQLALKYAAEFGLTPSSRVRLGIDPQKSGGAAAKYLAAD